MLLNEIVFKYNSPVKGSTVTTHDKTRIDDEYNLSKKGSRAQEIKKELEGKSVSHLARASKRAKKNSNDESIHATERYKYSKIASLMDQIIHLRQ